MRPRLSRSRRVAVALFLVALFLVAVVPVAAVEREATAPGLLSLDAPPGKAGMERGGSLPTHLVVVCDENYPPYAFRDDEGRLKGIVPDQWAAWSRLSGISIELIGLPWAKAIEAFESGAADVLDTVFETADRRTRYDFTPAYARIEVPVFIHKSVSGIATAADLKGFRVAAKSGDAAIGELVSRGVRSIDFYDDYAEIIEAAERMDIRIFCVDKPPALYLLYKKGLDKDFRIAFVMNEGAFHRAVLKGKPGLLSLVQNGFEAIGKREYERIDRTWLGAPLSSKVDLRLLGIGGALALIAVLALAALAWALRRRVTSATAQLREKVAQLERSEARNKAFISALPDLFFTFDLDGRFLEINVSDDRKLSMPPVMFLGKRIDELGFPDRILAAFRSAIAEVRGGGALALFEYAIPVGGEERLFEGRLTRLSEDRLLLVSRDITEREAQEERLRASLAEKEVLLKEIHHRVKNNMQVISSLMSLQAGAFHDDEDRVLLAETQVRIHAMARIHELLYDSPDLASIDAGDYLDLLARELMGSYGQSAIRLRADSARLTLDEAVPLGLIANELATNAIKYAYRPDESGEIVLDLRVAGEELFLSIADQGAGLPPGVDPNTAESMGFLLVRSLASQLGAELSFSGPPGFGAELRLRPVYLRAEAKKA